MRRAAHDRRQRRLAAASASRARRRATQHTGQKLTLDVDGHEIAFSNLNKVFWPAHGDQRALTKRDLLVYFARVAPYLLPHCATAR